MPYIQQWSHILLVAHQGTRQKTILYVTGGKVVTVEPLVATGEWPQGRGVREVRRFYRRSGALIQRLSRRQWQRLPDWQQGRTRENWSY